MHVNTVVPAEGNAQSEAYLVVRNNDRQSLELRLPKGANIRAVQVDGKAETPRRGEGGTVLIPIPSGLRKDQAFVVAFVYDHEVERGGAFFETVRLQSPVPQHVKSDLLTWAVYVPKEREITAFGGDLVRSKDGGSWALRLLGDLTSLLKRKPAGQAMDMRKLTQEFEKSPFQLRFDGERHEFTNRVGTGEVTLTSVSPTGFLFLKLALLVGAFLGARVLVRVARGLGYGRMAAFLAPALLLLALLIPAGPGLSALLTAMFVGVLLSGAVSFLAWVAQGRAERAAAEPPEPPGSDPAGPPPLPPQPATGGAA
jgi:hypothetical protein